MKMRRYLRDLAAGLCAVMLAFQPALAHAAPAEGQNGYEAVFDAEYYYNTYPDLQQAFGMDRDRLFEHFVNFGAREGRSGCADFNLRAYMQNNLDLLGALGADYGAYCAHYAKSGRAEGRNALPAAGKEEALMGAYATGYDVSELRAVNVEVAASRINGIILQPGDQFSFNASVLPRTSLNGYVPGPAFQAGKEVEAIGGGICQVSSTLFVAMLLSGMPATERHYHSLPVDYVPAGLDATIAGNYKDLKFTNVFDYPVGIKAAAEDGTLTVSLYKA